MATGEQIISSEEYFDYNCTPCSQQDRFIEAKRFCVECGEYFCSTCLSCHEKFSATKGHTLVKCEKVQQEHGPARLSKCEVHIDNMEDMVCCDHNVVCCRVCATNDHSSCQNIDYLARLAQKHKEDGKRENVEKDLTERMQEIKIKNKDYTIQALKLRTRKATHLKRLEGLKKSITDCVDIVIKAEKDIKNQFGPAVRDIQKDIQNNDDILAKLSGLSESLSCEGDDIDMFKKVLECKRMLNDVHIESCELDDKIAPDEKIQNELVEAVNKCFNQLFGTLKIEGSGSIDVPILYLKEGDSSSSVFLSDIYSHKLRSFEIDSTQAESFDFEGCIWGICKVSKYEIALTLPILKKVQVLSMPESPVLKSSFPTRMHCRGIAYLNGKFYVTGGGKIMEGQGQINVFDADGKLVCKYIDDSEGKYFSVPRSIIVNTEGIYVADQQNGIICLDLEGRRKWVCNNTVCKFPWGICFTPNGNLFVSGRDSNNIVIVSKDGKYLGELLNGHDGLSSPKALVMDKRSNRIIISEWNKRHLKMFYVSDCEI